MSSKFLSVLIIISFAAVSFAHLPSVYDASLRSRQTGLGIKAYASVGRELRADDYSNKGEWSDEGDYKGNWAIGQGDTVSRGEWKGKKLWWRAKFASSASDIPGETPPKGGTSAWVLINSLSAVATGTPNYVWKGWNGDLAAKGGNMWAEVPTWRDGAEGAYSMTHDDIGAMPFEDAVKPGWDVAKDYPLIKQSWGIYVGEMDDWDQAILMVKDGHEMFNHSMDHTSAADRWSVYNPGQRISATDPDVPEQIHGLVVAGAWKIKIHRLNNKGVDIGWSPEYDLESRGNSDFPDPNGAWDGTLNPPNYYALTCVDTLVASNDLVEIRAYPDWTGMSPNEETPGGGSGIIAITPKIGTEEVTLSTGQKMYVNRGLGKVSVNEAAWLDYTDIVRDFPFYENKQNNATKNDLGRNAFVLKVHSANGWDDNLKNRNVVEANSVINSELYDKIPATPYFVNGKRSEYFGYPFDVYSETMHKYLEEKGFVGARGGAKSGAPMPGDFYHPYRIDFDAFFIQDADWTAYSAGGKYIYPSNPHVLLGLNQLVDRVIESKGYMIREFHAVANITSDGDWYKNQGVNDPNADTWDVNNPENDRGGWWGGIAAFQLRAHYDWLSNKITNRQVAVYTPSEAVKYRMTANAVNKTGTLTKDGNNYKLKLTTTENIDNKYRDEISVIVALDITCNSLAAKYGDGAAGTDIAPRRRPIKMDGEGRIYSVSVNPFRSNGEITLIPDGQWEGVTGGEEGTAWTSLSDNRTPPVKQNAISFAGIRNGKISLNLTAGNYTAQLYNLQGRLISSTDISAVNGVNATNLRTDNLAKGMFILNVKQAGRLLLNNKIMIK